MIVRHLMWRVKEYRMMSKKIRHKILALSLVVVMAIPMGNLQGTYVSAKKAPALNVKKLTLQVKKSAKLKVKNVKKAQIKKITWKSTKKKVAKVNSVGKVTALKAGSTKISCKLKLKNGEKYTLTCKVKVKKEGTSGNNPSESSYAPSATTVAPAASSNPTSVPVGSDTPGPVTTAPAGNDTSAPATTAPAGDKTPAPATTAPVETSAPTLAPGSHLSANGIPTIDNGVMRSDLSAFDIVHDMGIGINLGNTMEACGSWLNSSNVSDYETAWGAPITTQKMITGMKQAGFRSIRIPVAWSNIMSTDGKYTINNDYFNRVETIMNYAFNEGMYVIVNIHFDSGWWARFGSTDADERAEAMNKYKTMWTQIANRYKEYSDYLIFESANEELGARLNSKDDYENSGYFSGEDELYAMTNTINQTFVNIVRGTGGNNSKRHLLIAGYDTDITKTCDARYQMPTDSISDHMMVSIHYYSPSTYCIVDDVNNSWGYRDSWGSGDDIAAMKSDLSNMKVSFVNKGIPVIIGEYGVCDTKLSETSFQRKEGRDVFFKTVCEYALNNGMVPMLWDTGSAYDRSSAKIKNTTEAANFLAMKELAEKNPVYVPAVGKDTLSWNGTVGNDSWNPVAPVAGEDCDFVMTSVGGCYSISGVDWTAFDHPTLTLHSDSLTGNVTYKIATTVNTGNQYYFYMEGDQVKKTGNWNFSSDQVIDLSDLNLSGGETVYIHLANESFGGQVNLTISNKK